MDENLVVRAAAGVCLAGCAVVVWLTCAEMYRGISNSKRLASSLSSVTVVVGQLSLAGYLGTAVINLAQVVKAPPNPWELLGLAAGASHADIDATAAQLVQAREAAGVAAADVAAAATAAKAGGYRALEVILGAVPGGGGGSIGVLRAVGLATLAFVGFGLFAWWRNRTAERTGPPVTPEDIAETLEGMKEGMEVEHVFSVLVQGPCLARALRRRREGLGRKTVEAVGKQLAATLLAEQDAERREGYEVLEAKLETYGARRLLERGQEVSDDAKVVSTVLHARLFENKIGLRELRDADELSGPVVAEMDFLLKLSGQLLDQMLLHSLKSRWRVTALATLEFTALFAAALWSKSDPECLKLMRESIEKDDQAIPDISLSVALEHEAETITSGEQIAVNIDLNRGHALSKEEAAKLPPPVMAMNGAPVPREAYWLFVEMSNGEETRLAGVTPLWVEDMSCEVLNKKLPMKAPITPGNYSMTFRAVSPTVVGFNAITTTSFKVLGREGAQTTGKPSPEEPQEMD